MLPSINIRDSVERHDAETRERTQPQASGPANGYAPETQAAPRAAMVFQNISRATQEMPLLRP
jgi:hypothetical protein